MRRLLLASILYTAVSSAGAAVDDSTYWYLGHLGALECVPLHDVDVNNTDRPVAYGNFARTPAEFVAELRPVFGSQATIAMTPDDGSGVIGVNVTLASGKSTMIPLILGRAGCKAAMAAVAAEK